MVLNYNEEENKYSLPFWAYTEKNHLKIDHYALADKIVKDYYFTMLNTGKTTIIYAYDKNKGIYKRVWTVQIKQIIQTLLQQLTTDLDKIKYYSANVLEDIEIDFKDKHNNFRIKKTDIETTYAAIMCSNCFKEVSSLNDFDADENRIVFDNGVLNLETGKLEDFNPCHRATIQIPVSYNPKCNKEPKTFNKFINHLANNDDKQRAALLETIGVAISNISVGQKCKRSVFLQGNGNCGKSVFLELIEKLVGTQNFTAMKFEALKGDFAFANLYGKRVAADADCSTCDSTDISNFKLVSSGDTIMANFKNETPFPFTFRGLYIVATNSLPYFSGDKGQWVYDRMLLIQCGDTIPEKDRDKQMLSKLIDEAESIVYYAVEALKELMQNGYNFTVSNISKKLMNQYKVNNDMYLSFLEECCIPITGMKQDSESVLKAGDMWEACKNYIEDNYGKTEATKANRKSFHEAILSKYGVKELKEVRGRTGQGKLFFKFTLAPEYIKYKPE